MGVGGHPRPSPNAGALGFSPVPRPSRGGAKLSELPSSGWLSIPRSRLGITGAVIVSAANDLASRLDSRNQGRDLGRRCRSWRQPLGRSCATGNYGLLSASYKDDRAQGQDARRRPASRAPCRGGHRTVGEGAGRTGAGGDDGGVAVELPESWSVGGGASYGGLIARHLARRAGVTDADKNRSLIHPGPARGLQHFVVLHLHPRIDHDPIVAPTERRRGGAATSGISA